MATLGAGPDARAATRIAVLIPCFNEERTIARVVNDFRAALPDAEIYVYDNNSTDSSIDAARAAGAIVRRESRQGKGHVIRRMFGDVEADIYLLVDGDATYDATSAPAMIAALADGGNDMVVGARVMRDESAYRRGHQFGNRALTRFVATVFGAVLTDMLSGYRVFSRRFVKSFPVLSSGFEIETEMTIHAAELDMGMVEIETPYCARPEGSVSKLNTWRDGLRIILMILGLYRAERPMAFFGLVGAVLIAVLLLLGIPIVITYLQIGLVPRLPTAILATGLMILAFLSIASGFILETVTRGPREMKLLAYLAQSPTKR